MVGHGELFGRVGQSREAHHAVGHEDGSLLSVAECYPAAVLVVGHVLWLGEVFKLVCHVGLIPDGHGLAGLAVGIVVHGAATIILHVLHGLWQLHGIAQAGQREAGARSRHGALVLHRAIGMDGVDHIGGELEVGLLAGLYQASSSSCWLLKACRLAALALHHKLHADGKPSALVRTRLSSALC